MQPIQFSLIKNTVRTNDLKILKELTNLKNLYSKQLSKMPRQYIVKLLFDTVHESLIMKMDGKIVAGITFRGFNNKPFYEIAFLAVNNQNQCTGLGSKVMNKFKNHCQSQNIEHLFTFADDGAIGFFQKHGFSNQISLPETQYKSYVKEYIGGCLMECRFNLKLKVDFQKLKDYIKDMQHHIVYEKVKPLLCLAPYDLQRSGRILRQKQVKCKTLGELCQYIPGLKEAGYSKDIQKEDTKKLTLQFLLQCQQFIELVHGKASLLKDVIEFDEQGKSLQTPQNIHRQNTLKDYEFLLYKIQRKLKFGHYKYKDEIIGDFTSQLKEILSLDDNLRPNEKEFLTKINQLKYEFMKNLLTQQKLKTQKVIFSKSVGKKDKQVL